MKKTPLGLLALGMAASAHAQSGPRIRLDFGTNTVTVELNQSPAAQALAEQLPLALAFEDYNGLEKIAYLPKKLPAEGSPRGYDPAPGDFAYYAPWGNIILFYGEAPYAAGLIPLGKVLSGQKIVSNIAAGEQAQIRK